MKNQTYRMTMLYDFYGELLTDRQKEFFDLYYNEDLSLAEIAENAGISRQGVRDVIVRAEGVMQEIEDKTAGSSRCGAIWTPLSRPPRKSKPSTTGSMRTPGSRSWQTSSGRKPLR
mgnify:CR=1 FL=1